jgi:hypothetical protein
LTAQSKIPAFHLSFDHFVPQTLADATLKHRFSTWFELNTLTMKQIEPKGENRGWYSPSLSTNNVSEARTKNSINNLHTKTSILPHIIPAEIQVRREPTYISAPALGSHWSSRPHTPGTLPSLPFQPIAETSAAKHRKHHHGLADRKLATACTATEPAAWRQNLNLSPVARAQIVELYFPFAFPTILSSYTHVYPPTICTKCQRSLIHPHNQILINGILHGPLILDIQWISEVDRRHTTQYSINPPLPFSPTPNSMTHDPDIAALERASMNSDDEREAQGSLDDRPLSDAGGEGDSAEGNGLGDLPTTVTVAVTSKPFVLDTSTTDDARDRDLTARRQILEASIERALRQQKFAQEELNLKKLGEILNGLNRGAGSAANERAPPSVAPHNGAPAKLSFKRRAEVDAQDHTSRDSDRRQLAPLAANNGNGSAALAVPGLFRQHACPETVALSRQWKPEMIPARQYEEGYDASFRAPGGTRLDLSNVK